MNYKAKVKQFENRFKFNYFTFIYCPENDFSVERTFIGLA